MEGPLLWMSKLTTLHCLHLTCTIIQCLTCFNMACPRISNAENCYFPSRKHVTLYSIGFQNKTDNATMLVHQMYVHYFSSQHFDVHNPCFETHIFHFPYCQTSGQDTNLRPGLYKHSPIYIV